MDNTPAPIPSTSPQPAVKPEVFTPSESPNRRWLLWSAIGLTFLIFGIAIGIFSAKLFNQSTTQSQISSYEDCLAAKGSIVQYSYPATCVTASGQRFVQPLTDEEKQSLQPPDLYREQNGSAATADWKTYTDPDQSYSFQYPNIWTILSQTPKEFQATKSYVEGETLENWLNGKMMASKCRGPIMQNLEHPELLIVFEVVPANSDGGFCWSLGHFMEDNKWKVADSYMYPPGNGALQAPTWKGDYFFMREVMKNANLRVFAALINRETYSFQGKDEFDQILSTFKFLD